ncbi:SpoIIE family protein phosphatase [Kitasatospora sp. MBT63]|uniref:ATP-binding SpoIIE family protein phosphatase n=1 Tax=Kitasatospora sp. MBT63 TaxID=1444768 RepID=UPI00053ADBD7|nr:SpoIIE family protein phosphatase [Kitasatospora sp. MBT63]
MDAAVLDALFTQSPVGLHVLDPRLRLVRVNTAAYRINDFRIHEMLGRPLWDILTAFQVPSPDEVEALAREILETGTPVLDLRLHIAGRDPAVEAVMSVSGFRLEDPDGTVLGLATSLTDITERTRAEERLRLLEKAAGTVGTTLDTFRTAQELCDLALPGFADSAAVDVLDLVLRGDAVPAGACCGNATVRRAGFRSASGRHREGVPRVGEVDTYPGGTPHWDVLTRLRPRLIRRMGAHTHWLDPTRPRDARLLAAGVHSMMVVPLRARRVVLGLVSFYRWHNQVPFGRADLAVAELLASRAALSIDNARLYQREHSAARILRSHPHRPPDLTGAAADTAGAYLPAAFGGAFVDVIPLSGARVALVAGDTTGRKSSDAAQAMGELRAALTALSDLDLAPDEILHRLHDLANGPEQDPEPGGVRPAFDTPATATCLYLIYDPVTRLCTMANAGHALPVLAHAGGATEHLEMPRGPALGRGIAHYPLAERVLPEGATLLLHTTALLPADGPAHRLPLDLLPPVPAGPTPPLQETCEAVLAAIAPARPRHDAALLLARTHQLDRRHTVSWTLDNRPQVVSEARKLIRDQLAAWSLDTLADTTQLIASELITNAVRYADGPIDLRLIRDHTLICEVTDDSSTAPQLRRALDSDEHGRGLFITAQLTDRWGVRPTGRGKTIWAEQPLAADDA